MNLRFVEWIWQVRGSLVLAPGQTSEDAFDRLDPLFREFGTTHERATNTLTFRKKDQPAQDKMSVFDHGILFIEKGADGGVLRYRLSSRILLFCFLAPLLFLAVAQLTIFVAELQKDPAETAEARKKAEQKAEKKAALPQNPIDKFLGAPAPEKPKKKGADKSKKDDKKPKPTAAYVFAAIFATLYLVGRILEGRLVKSLFRKRLLGS